MHTKEKKSCCYIPMGRSNEHINGDAPIRVYRWARRKSTALSPLPQCLSPPHWRRRLLPLSSLSTTRLCLSASLSAPHRTVMALESFAPGRARGISLSTSQSQAGGCRTGAAVFSRCEGSTRHPALSGSSGPGSHDTLTLFFCVSI
jgi:hypothetical protein